MLNPNFSIKYSHLKTVLATLKDFCVKKSTSVHFLLVRVRTLKDMVEFYAYTPDNEQITLTCHATIHNPLPKDLGIYTQDLIRTLSTGFTPTEEISFSHTNGSLTLDYSVPRLAISGTVHCEEWLTPDYDLFPNVKPEGEYILVRFQEGTLSKALDSLPATLGMKPNMDRVILDVLNGRVVALSTDAKTLTAVSSDTDAYLDGKEIGEVMDVLRYRPTISDRIVKAICTLSKKDTASLHIRLANDNGKDLVRLSVQASNSPISAHFDTERRSGFDTHHVWPRKDNTHVRIKGLVSALLEPLTHVCSQVPRNHGVWLDLSVGHTPRFLVNYVDKARTFKVDVPVTLLEQEYHREGDLVFAFDPRLLQTFLKGLSRTGVVTIDLPAYPFGPMLCSCLNIKTLIMPMRSGDGDKTYKTEEGDENA